MPPGNTCGRQGTLLEWSEGQCHMGHSAAPALEGRHAGLEGLACAATLSYSCGEGETRQRCPQALPADPDAAAHPSSRACMAHLRLCMLEHLMPAAS